MDAKKLGLFICKTRKENHMTQKELAETIHVTDKSNKSMGTWCWISRYSIIRTIVICTTLNSSRINDLSKEYELFK